MNTPETINIEKYAKALNELIGVDSAYMAGDKDVDAIVELIVAAKKLENRVKKLTEENEKLRGLYEHNSQLAIDSERKLEQYKKSRDDELSRVHMLLSMAWESIEQKDQLLGTIKADTVREIQEKIRAKSEYGTINISLWQLDQIAKEVLEENK